MKALRVGFLFVVISIVCVSCFAQTVTNDKVFGVGMGVIGIVNADKIQFYQQRSNSWITDPDDDFPLPKGYQSLFSPGLGVIGIVSADKIQFYQQRNNSWITDPDDDFIM